MQESKQEVTNVVSYKMAENLPGLAVCIDNHLNDF